MGSEALASIYYQTIHNVNSQDYSQEQLDAWATSESLKETGWEEKWGKVVPIVADINGKPVGFAELESNGHIDCFYVPHEYQGHEVGSKLMDEIINRIDESGVNRLFAEVSITAKPFFVSKSFYVIKE